MANKSAVIMAGGTGGHIFPGLAVAETLRASGWGIDWLGTQAGLESRLVPAANIPLHLMSVQGIRGKGWLGYIYAPLMLLKAIYQAVKILKRLKPNLIIGFGGFVAGPGGIAARMMGLPLIIHEQNAIAGTTNRLLAKVATRVLTAFPNVISNATVVGNPIRKEIGAIEKPERRLAGREGAIRFLVVGGSRGAKAVNELVPRAFALLPPECGYMIRHQVGRGHRETTQAFYDGLGSNAAQITEFIDDMQEAYRWADVVVSRAGASTVSELAVVGVASLLIPFPFAIDDHQTANAEFLTSAGAGKVYQQHSLSPEALAKSLQQYYFDRDQILAMSIKARACAKTETLETFAQICEDMTDVQ